MSTKEFDTEGRAYDLKKPSYDPVLVQVGPGTPGGELLRRYWQPIALSSDATELPKQIRRFGEELILFRNKNGEAGLVYPRCVHRGSSLLYGRVEQDGIRCCYHGWKFSNQGVCLDQPAEPGGGRNRQRVRQPWYPVVEKYGAIFAYMGPPDRQPLFPVFSNLEDLAEDEETHAFYFSSEGEINPFPVDHNWFQFWENTVDHFHVPILHSMISGDQFTQFRMSVMPEVEWSITDAKDSILTKARRAIEEHQETYIRIAQAMIPNRAILPPFHGVGGARDISVAIPLDDTNFVVIQLERRKKGSPPMDFRTLSGFGPKRKLWNEMSAEEHQRYPNDYEAQGSQGAITFHSEEHLASSDVGIGMLRRLFKQQCDIVANGGDPIGVAFREEDRLVQVEAKAFALSASGEELKEIS